MDKGLFDYQASVEQVIKSYSTSLLNGLTNEEIEIRKKTQGLNKIEDQKKKSTLKIFISQFSDFLSLLLIAAALISGFTGEIENTISIIVIILLNSTLGFIQEFRAEKAMEALKKLSALNAKVIRSGKNYIIPAIDLVQGDIILLEAGNIIPADIRILEAFSLKIDESLLTGESQTVEKNSAPISIQNVAIADQLNMGFSGTIATNGRATALVVKTGMRTEIARLSLFLNEENIKTPLQKRMDKLAKTLSLIVIILCLIIFLTGLINGAEISLMFITALSLAVAGIPEALPAVLTISLAIGSRILAKKRPLSEDCQLLKLWDLSLIFAVIRLEP